MIAGERHHRPEIQRFLLNHQDQLLLKTSWLAIGYLGGGFDPKTPAFRNVRLGKRPGILPAVVFILMFVGVEYFHFSNCTQTRIWQECLKLLATSVHEF